jgi:glucose-6-phosphate isomerase
VKALAAPFTRGGGPSIFDYSKNRITDETLKLLLDLAEMSRAARARATPCSAATRSTSPEKRAVLHVRAARAGERSMGRV